MAEGADGIRIATASGGTGPENLLFVHATGFCKETWDPVIAAMDAEAVSWLSMDLRGHGDSETGAFPHHWSVLGRDVIGVLEDRTSVVGVGHSVGGAAVARAAVERPESFRHLILIEPIIFPSVGKRLDGPMSAVAGRRRRVFSSRTAARERFKNGPFSAWVSDSLDAYLDGGFELTSEGFSLKCTPEVEADFFMEWVNHDTWDIVGSIEVPVTIVATEHSTTHREPYLSELVRKFADAELIVLDRADHLVPMEDPERVASLLDGLIALPSR